MAVSTFPSLHPLLDPSLPLDHHQRRRRCTSPAAAVHGRALRIGLLDSGEPSLIAGELLRLYTTYGDLSAARTLLLCTRSPSLRDFNALISAHSAASLPNCSLQVFDLLINYHGTNPNEFTLPHVLRSASVLGLLNLGRQIHSYMIKQNGLNSNVYCTTALLDLYSKWASLGDVCKLFDRMPERNIVSWNTLLSAFAQNGLIFDSLQMLKVMEESGIEVDKSSWNSVIAGCVRLDDAELALEVFIEMVASGGVLPDAATFNTLLPLIPKIPSLSLIKEFHCLVLRFLKVAKVDLVDEDRLYAAIASGYAFHGCVLEASLLFERVSFKTTQLWVSMISAFLECGKIHGAFDLFRRVSSEFGREARPLSKVLLTLLLPECSTTKTGLEIHAYAYRRGLDTINSVCNALMAMYGKRGDITSCLKVFTRTPEKDVISYNTVLSSYALSDDFACAFELFHHMLSEGCKPDEFSFSAILNACGHSSQLQPAMAVHGHMVKSGFAQSFLVVQNALMDAYGKCGCLEEARKVFDEMEDTDEISWNTMISCYGFSDRPQEAFMMFSNMTSKGWKPSRVTFVALLSACSHAGLLNEGLHFFEMMSNKYGIKPGLDHYACIVDNLGRAGQLNRAYQFVKDMPIEPDDCIWSALLSACRIHGNIELAEIAAKRLIELDPQHSGYRVLLSNIYAGASKWDYVAEVRAAMKDGGVRKYPGCSWIELCGSEVCRFITADKSHKQSDEIYVALNCLMEHLKDEDYIPDIVYKLESADSRN